MKTPLIIIIIIIFLDSLNGPIIENWPNSNRDVLEGADDLYGTVQFCKPPPLHSQQITGWSGHITVMRHTLSNFCFDGRLYFK